MTSEDIAARLTRFYDAEGAERSSRPLEAERVNRRESFIAEARVAGVRDLLEVGCGVGRDGIAFRKAGFSYLGLDLAPESVRRCRDLGLEAVVGSATELPCADHSMDAAWSMSTLMHLPGDGLTLALAELRRVVRPGGLVAIGVWGSATLGPHELDDGRFFYHRSDAELRAELERLGEVSEIATWGWHDDGTHYQWATVRVGD